MVASACSGEATDDGGDGGGPSACGLAGAAPASECTGLGTCGGGASNAIEPEFCEHCLLRPNTHLCEAGACRTLGATGNIMTQVGVPPAAAGAKSYTIASIFPVMADGRTISCEKLTTTCGFLGNGAINTTNSTFKRFAEPARTDSVYPALISAEAGAGRILFIQVTSDEQGKGMVLARGCTQDITVAANETVTVPIDIR